MISVMVITIDRFEISSKVIPDNLTGYHPNAIDLLWADNGSKDHRIIAHMQSMKPAYSRINRGNEGCAKAFNQLFLRSRGEYLCLMGNDIAMPVGWVESAIQHLDNMPNAGFVGFSWGIEIPPVSKKFGIEAHWLTPQLNRVFGTMVFKRRLVEELGFFSEEYGPYGLEDSDLSERANIAGFNSCYVKDMSSQHLVHDVGEQTEYRKMKDASLSSNLTIFSRRVEEFKTGFIKEELPPRRDPIG